MTLDYKEAMQHVQNLHRSYLALEKIEDVLGLAAQAAATEAESIASLERIKQATGDALAEQARVDALRAEYEALTTEVTVQSAKLDKINADIAAVKQRFAR